MLDRGLLATLNSDDPAYFGGYLEDNFTAIDQALGLGRDQLAVIARNGFAAMFLPPAEKEAALADFDRSLPGVG
jgi:adenosine deaminase